MFKGKRGLLFASIVSIGLLAGCGQEKSEEEKLAEALKEAFGSNVNVAEEGSVEAALGDIRNFVTMDLWNEGFVDISHYIGSGTSSTGQTIDINFTIERLDKAMKKKSEHDQYINKLGDEYAEIKSVWSKLSAETDRLYEYVKQNPPKANSEDDGFDTGLFQQYRDAFADDVSELIDKNKK